ncbi:MAG: helix-turn-helix domain-containing protein [Candidatus Tectimicrobiota bacterium]
MAHPAYGSTLGQLLRQARHIQGLSIRQVAARLHHPDGRAITPKYLSLLEHDQRRPSLALAYECAMVLALDVILVLTLAHRAEGLLQQYLQRYPHAERGLIELLARAEQQGFTAWERVTRQLVVPQRASAAMRTPGTRQRRLATLHQEA